MTKDKKDSCSICEEPRFRCSHPWDKPFEYWPDKQKIELWQQVGTKKAN